MNILIIGNGGREHAILNALLKSKSVKNIYVTSGGNGGTQNIKHASISVTNVSIGASPKDFPELLKYAISKKVDLVVPGPEQPLVDGIVDYFKNNNDSGRAIQVFGPSAKAAKMEGSKTFSKDFMHKHAIPTAKYKNFSDFAAAKAFVEAADFRVVIKASGIAAGKGVLIPENKEEAVQALEDIMVKKQFGAAGDEVVVEEFLDGFEISILTISDGYSFVSFPPSQDHKKVGENDTGLNTGGMGSYAPTPLATKDLCAKIDKEIIKPSIDGMRKDGFPFVGVLFTGVIVTEHDNLPKVLEYNVRFGDPETQSVLPLLDTEKTDLAQVFLAASEGRLDSVPFAVNPDLFAATVVLVAGGYPESYKKGDIIAVDESKLASNMTIVHSGTKLDNSGNLVTNGGRVIAVTATANDLKTSVAECYKGLQSIKFSNMYCRKDIAYRALGSSASASTSTSKTGLTYAAAGVSVDNGNLLVDEIKALVKSTKRPGADSDIGGFGGLFDLAQAGYTDSNKTLLVAATDGVGTKLRIAQESGIHDTVGIDLVAMNVNDLVVQGAEPLFFLDYFATGSLDVNIAKSFVKGVVDGCKLSNCALVGGETSEMPGMYEGNHYDTNGTAVGAVLKTRMLPQLSAMKSGDVVLGLKSDGLHSNGFSLVRKIIEVNDLDLNAPAPWDSSMSVAQSCLTPTRIYVRSILSVLKSEAGNGVLGLAHITGGGLVENVPRCLPKDLAAKINFGSWPVGETFKWFGKNGGVPLQDFFKTFNAGIGMVVIVDKSKSATVAKLFEQNGETVYTIGELEKRQSAGCYIDGLTQFY